MIWVDRWREARAEAAVRRQLMVLERGRWLAASVRLGLLEECDRADQLAGRRGGFVETARIRELIGGGDA